MMDNPIFVVGNPRSGTTMFRLILAAHSKVSIPPETTFIVKLYVKYGHIQSFSSSQLLSLCHDLSEPGPVENLAEQWQISLTHFFDDIESLVGGSYSDFCSALYMYYAREKGLAGKQFWGDKNNAYGNYIDILASMYPGARFIHLVRDGRAVLSSYKQLRIDKSQKYAPLLPKKTAIVAKNWVDMVTRISRHLNQFAEGRFIEVKYEDVLTDFEGTISKVCSFLNIEYEAQMKQFDVMNNKYHMEPDSYSWKDNTRKPLDPSKAIAWKQKLSEEDVVVFESAAGHVLNQYRYSVAQQYVNQTKFSPFSNLKVLIREGFRRRRRLIVSIRKLLAG